MTTRQQVAEEIAALPEERLDAVLGFIRSIKVELIEPALLTEAVLAREWSTPEEDAAWADL